MPEIVAAFEIEKVTGKFTRTVTVIEETHNSRMVNGVERITTTRKLKPIEETFDEGYMIWYPQGHSIFVAADDEAQLRFLGVIDDPKLVDLESGEDVPDGYLSNKDRVQAKERARSGRRSSSTGGIAAALEG